MQELKYYFWTISDDYVGVVIAPNIADAYDKVMASEGACRTVVQIDEQNFDSNGVAILDLENNLCDDCCDCDGCN